MIRRARRYCLRCRETFEHKTRLTEHTGVAKCSACYLHPADEWRPIGSDTGDLLDLLAGEDQ